MVVVLPSSSLTRVPVFVGIDLGKNAHAWHMLSPRLLKLLKQYQRCPHGTIKNERAGFEAFLKTIRAEAGERTIHILCEHTGHYGYALEQFLQEQEGIKIYRTQAKKRYSRDKTDRKDAEALAVRLYNQVGLRAPVTDERERVSRLLPPIPAAVRLYPLVHRRVDISHALTQTGNRLTSILDQLFPELTQIFADPKLPAPLNLRERFPTAQEVAAAPLPDLIATRHRTKPSNDAYSTLQALAQQSIGLKSGPRQASLVVEQAQLIAQVHLLRQQEKELDTAITAIMTGSREGRILLSVPGFGPVLAPQLLAGIGNIQNFTTPGRFRAYLGWAPRRSQTGTTFDKSSLDRSGNKLCKQAMYQATLTAIRRPGRWQEMHARLVARGMAKMPALGHVAGQLAVCIYALLKQDADLARDACTSQEPLPPPVLYDHAR